MQKDDIYAQIVLMLIYSGVRVSELLDLKREDVHIDEHCFNVVHSKTSSGIRMVPIHDKTYPIFQKWYEEGCEYLLHTPDGGHFTYRNYYDSYWTPIMKRIGCTHTPYLYFYDGSKECQSYTDKEDCRTFRRNVGY